MKYRMAWILMFTMISLAGWCADSYGSRGFKVQLRAAERPDAPVVGEEELYGNSDALVIGIDAYRPPWPRLSNAVKDADLVAEVLTKEPGVDWLTAAPGCSHGSMLAREGQEIEAFPSGLLVSKVY